MKELVAAALLSQLDGLALDVWKAHGAGLLDDGEAQHLAEIIHARKAAQRATSGHASGATPLGRLTSIFPAKRRQRPPDRAASIARRRTIAASGPLPPALASRFTEGQRAVLGIVADEVASRGECKMTIAEISAKAGVSPRLAQTAIRLAETDGLLLVVERRRKGQVNLPNVLRVLSREWTAWLRRARPTGCRRLRATDTKGFLKVEQRLAEPLQELPRGQGGFHGSGSPHPEGTRSWKAVP
ncbi:hypothetical protein [Methylobacterium crusticola]|uniref:hypothetical protein n=1 Tax=Methylobacterium crusticola TaxID=1697972 RepID=UPI001FD24B8A|nr:hypothetical protein [Methylobacterium crusticola]